MKPGALLLLGILAIAGAEIAARWWMHPPASSARGPVLEWSPPSGGGWHPRPEAYAEVELPLHSSSGWIGDVESGGRLVRLSFLRWDQTTTSNTLEAFKHLPEQCMGSVGMELESRHPTRELKLANGTLNFDVTRFRTRSGDERMFVYKAVWVEGYEQLGLRNGLSGFDGQSLRSLRLAAVWNRFRPAHTRVVMGGIPGMPTEELAWREFRRLVEPCLTWRQPAASVGAPGRRPDIQPPGPGQAPRVPAP